MTEEILLRKTAKYSKFLVNLPFVKAIILNGSLASGKAKETSDIDLLVIAKTGRIFTVRFLVNSLLSLLGQKRPSNNKKPHAGKFCPNYFLTDDYLIIPTGRGEEIDSYCTKNYSNSVLIAGEAALFDQFMKQNNKLFNKYSDSLEPPSGEYKEKLSRFFPLQSDKQLFKKFIENTLSRSVGDWAESILKKFQLKKINSDPRTAKYPDLIVCNDRELRFHPPKGS